MRYEVNSWRVDPEGNKFFVITNVEKSYLRAKYNRETGRYSYCNKYHFNIPKSVKNFCEGKSVGRFGVVLDDGAFSYRTFGVEIECFHPTNSNIRNEVGEALVSAGVPTVVLGYTHEVRSTWKITTDSSINGGYSLEVVSPILKGEEGIEEVKKVMKVLSSLGCRVNRSTGTHVHQGAADLTDGELKNIFLFYKENEEYLDMLVANSRRGDNNGLRGMNYCASLKNIRTPFPPGRYYKLNYQAYIRYKTIEFRQHQGTLNGDKIEHWIKLTQRIMEVAKNIGPVHSRSFEEFLDTLRVSDKSWYLERVEELAA